MEEGVSVTKNEEVEHCQDKSEGSEGDEDAKNHLSGWPLSFLVMALMLSSFMLALDNTILATAIPRITSDFNSLNDIGWYGAAYLITQMSLLPTCGRIYTLYNVKYTFCIAIFVFEIGSIICAAAPSSTVLIVGRALAGVGAAALMSGAAVIISYSVALRKRAMLMAMLSGVYGIASVAGPLVGGVITDSKKLTWRFCFWINLPIGAISIVSIFWTLKQPPPAVKASLAWKEKLRNLDFPGAFFLISSIICLLLALQWGGIVFPWSDPKVYGCLIGFGLILTAFFIIQVRDQECCTIPLAIFRSRTVSVACMFMAFVQIAMVAQTYYWPIYFQCVKNTTARASGLYLLPLIISSTLCTLAAGWIISRIGFYVPFMWIGAPILATGSGLYLLMKVHSPAWHWIIFQIVSGIGYGVCTQIPLLSVQVVLDKADVPTGCVMVLFFQCLGGALATSISQNLFTDALLKKLQQIANVDGVAIVRAGVKDFRHIVDSQVLDRVIDVFNEALKNVYALACVSAGVALVVSLGMEWRTVPRKQKKNKNGNGTSM